ncbi:MAG: site-specific DNA-methyltransferase, partial [Deltaproteobacteria bacterium]|nr:site-specific DNA-methyltransferase [Deltaproteobacteria bacterium]
ESMMAFCQLCGAWRGCLGLEPTPEFFIQHMVQVFREIRRVLRSDGTLWLNLGDSYAGGGRGFGYGGKQDTNKGCEDVPRSIVPDGLKPKDLCGIPWRVALALQNDGWWLRSDIIWHKPNPMPESVTDRPTKAHEYIFLLTKSAKYFYDADAIKEDCRKTAHAGRTDGGCGPMYNGVDKRFNNRAGSWKNTYIATERNKRTVFSIPINYARLRKDLTTQQKQYIINEMIKRGLL